VEIGNTQLLLDGLVDNIQLTLAWHAGDEEVAALVSTFASDFLLAPQGQPEEVDGIMHQVFASITPTWLPATLLEGDKLTAMAFENPSGTDFTDRIWIANDEFTATSNGMYYVSVWGRDNTGSILKTTTGVGNEPAIADVQLYPNPVSTGKLNIQIGTSEDEALKVSVFNMQGKLMDRFEFQVHGNTVNRTSMDVSTLDPGAYMLLIEGNSMMFREMFIIR
jgi:hypothetical protein